MYRIAIVCLSLSFLSGVARASDYLLYLEAQSIFGYSSELKKPIYYSMNPDAEMQKPSLGFDYIKRFSGESGDRATLSVQGRLALKQDGDEYEMEPQIYNAYFKVKTPGPYVWIGHNRPSFGLSSYFDSHGLLLRTLAIQGFGYDRDWGAGMYKDFAWGDIYASATIGSGMPIHFRDNYMIAVRSSYGVLSQSNYNVGFSLGYGMTLDTMGYKLRDPDPRRMRLAGVDFTILRDNLEHRFDLLAGRWLDENTHAVSYRFGVNMEPEGRIKIEAQPTYWKFGEDKNYELALCFSFLATSNLTVRAMYTYDDNGSDNRIIMQLYYYRPM